MGRRWTGNDIAKLKSLAGKLPVKDIAAEFGRSFDATTLEAHKLGLSLKHERYIACSGFPLKNMMWRFKPPRLAIQRRTGVDVV